MNLDEAIKHCYEKAAELKAKADQNKLDVVEAAECLECAEEHRQLAAWLTELKQLREKQSRKVRLVGNQGKMTIDLDKEPIV